MGTCSTGFVKTFTDLDKMFSTRFKEMITMSFDFQIFVNSPSYVSKLF